MKNRKISEMILNFHNMKSGRILILTGARQTGKTTLAKRIFNNFSYLSIEDPVMRGNYINLTAKQWESIYPKAVLDEIQKEPVLIESIKSVYDQFENTSYILLGSSQLLLLEKVRESLAGRCIIVEFFPLTVPEIKTNSWEDEVKDSIFQEEIRSGFNSQFLPSLLFDNEHYEKITAWNQYVAFGGFPAVSNPELESEEKIVWLNNYIRTYLERDIRDLASFRDLEPFVKLQRYLAVNTGNLINASTISVQLGISAKTVQRYISYFELSYQALVLQAWSRNLNKRLMKMPKIHYMDNGVLQAVLKKRGGTTGNEFESLVVAEIYKQVRNINENLSFYHFRTYDGKKLDLLIEFPDYYIAFEIKMADKVSSRDAKNFDNIENILDKPLKRAFILSNDYETKIIRENIYALNVSLFLG